ncbi:MAG: hypothetical protein FJZ01_26050 [Candidatus Sericytochromatia bacterium]|nr:hypothetical protein [Candidatus Tanganyikabacteria bacterium]
MASNDSNVPWLIRVVDRLVQKQERWIRELVESPEFYEMLLTYASSRDERARKWLAEALSRRDYAPASRLWLWYLVLVIFVGLLNMQRGWSGIGPATLLLVFLPAIWRLDRLNRRWKAYRGLARGRATVGRKVDVKVPASGGRVFQSYWSEGTDHLLELDHPIELLETIRAADEFWRWEMPLPHEDGRGFIRESLVTYDLGLVRRDAQGCRHLLAGGSVYFDYDPWADRVDTRGQG